MRKYIFLIEFLKIKHPITSQFNGIKFVLRLKCRLCFIDAIDMCMYRERDSSYRIFSEVLTFPEFYHQLSDEIKKVYLVPLLCFQASKV